MSMDLQSCAFVAKAPAKINLFLKIIGTTHTKDGKYHLLQSRFMRIPEFYDTLGLMFEAQKFEVVGDFDCAMEQNTIYKAFTKLLEQINPIKQEALKHLKVFVEKGIPSGSGLGGASSNAACFLQAANAVLDLNLTQTQLMQIGAEVGSDVPFFLSGLDIANVEGRGEIITPCDVSSIDVEIITPSLSVSTKEVFKEFSKRFYNPQQCEVTKKESWLKKSNLEILSNNAFMNNDLLKPLLSLYPSLQSYCQKGVFLSGSGSCFWRCKEMR